MTRTDLRNLKNLTVSNAGLDLVINLNGTIFYPKYDCSFDVQKLLNLLLETISLKPEEKIGMLRSVHTLTSEQILKIENALELEKTKLKTIDKTTPGYLEEIRNSNLRELSKLAKISANS
jgi:hypothetical protein